MNLLMFGVAISQYPGWSRGNQASVRSSRKTEGAGLRAPDILSTASRSSLLIGRRVASNKPAEAKASSQPDEQGRDGHLPRLLSQLTPTVVHEMMCGFLEGLSLFFGVADCSVQSFSPATLAAFPICDAMRVPNFSGLVAAGGMVVLLSVQT